MDEADESQESATEDIHRQHPPPQCDRTFRRRFWGSTKRVSVQPASRRCKSGVARSIGGFYGLRHSRRCAFPPGGTLGYPQMVGRNSGGRIDRNAEVCALQTFRHCPVWVGKCGRWGVLRAHMPPSLVPVSGECLCGFAFVVACGHNFWSPSLAFCTDTRGPPSVHHVIVCTCLIFGVFVAIR